MASTLGAALTTVIAVAAALATAAVAAALIATAADPDGTACAGARGDPGQSRPCARQFP
jgi:hypothetical protein